MLTWLLRRPTGCVWRLGDGRPVSFRWPRLPVTSQEDAEWSDRGRRGLL